MKDAYNLQKASKGKLDQQLLAGHQKVALRSIAAIGYVGSRYRQTQLQLQASKAQDTTIYPIDTLRSCQLVEKCCFDRLFALLAVFSGMDDVLGSKQSGQDRRKRPESEGSWSRVPVSELDFEDDQTALFVSKILTAIEGTCEQWESARILLYFCFLFLFC